MIFSTLSGSSVQAPITPIIALAKRIVALSKKRLSCIVYGTLEYRS